MNSNLKLYLHVKKGLILQLKPNAHQQAVNNLNHQGFKRFLTVHSISSRKTSQLINTTLPLFPGYMFTALDKEKSQWHKINNTYGLLRLINFNSRLKSIPTKAMNELMAQCDLSGEPLPVKKLKKDDQVKILKGPFANFIATVETHEKDIGIWV